MTERWHRTSALVGLPGMPKSARPINHHGPRRGWISRRVNGHAQALEWLESSLPPETQAAISGEASAACALNPVSRLDARVEIVTAFDAWRPRDTALVPALKKWCALYKESGAGVSTETRAAIPGVAWNTLQRWRSAIRANGSSALLAGRGGRRSAIDESADLAAYVESHVRRNPRHVTARNIQRAVLAEFGAELSISQVRRWVRSWRAANGFALSAGEPDRHRSRTQPAFGDAAAEISALNGLWELDSTRVDVMCADGRRHAIVAAIDVWSRRAKVLVTPQSRGTAIAALIRNCMLAWGVPDCIRTDEGADYTSRYLMRVAADLEIVHEILPPYSPEKKPFVERFIGTLSRDFLTQLPGFTGHNVAQGQLLRERRSFAARRGEDATVTFRSDLSAEDLQRALDAWCDDLYGRTEHGGLGGISPFARAASWAGERRAAPDERALDMLLAPAAGDGRRKVGKNGILVDGGQYIAGDLGFHMGEWVHVRQDPADWGRVYVYTEPDADGRHIFICIAEDPVRTGIDRKAVAIEAKANWRARNRQERARTRELEREHRPAEAVEAVLAQAKREAEKVVGLPVRGEGHRTAALDAAADAADARDAVEEAARRRDRRTIFQRFYGGDT